MTGFANIDCTIAASIATVLAALSAPLLAWWGMRATAKLNAQAIESGLLMALMDQYASQQMVDDLRVLVSWKKDKGDDFAGEWRAALDKGDATAKLMDGARRRVKQYFLKPLRLYENGHVGLPFLKTAAGMDGLNVLIDVVKPLEAALNPSAEAPMRIDQLGRLCGESHTGSVMTFHLRSLGRPTQSNGA
jgi:hypothetical protein